MSCMAARSFLSAYLLVGFLNVIAIATQNSDGATVTKPLLMPLLAGWLVLELRRVWPVPLRWLGLGIAFAWVGDILLMGDSDLAFTLGIAAFLVTQVSYLLAFTRVDGVRFRRGIANPKLPAVGLVEGQRLLLLPFAAYLVLLVALLWPGAGTMRAPAVIYGVALCVMAAASLNLVGRMPPASAWLTFGGAVLFVLSDSLIALTEFGPWERSDASQALVMFTYVAAQGLIATGLVSGVQTNRTLTHPRLDVPA